jgi:hypothetical protein
MPWAGSCLLPARGPTRCRGCRRQARSLPRLCRHGLRAHPASQQDRSRRLRPLRSGQRLKLRQDGWARNRPLLHRLWPAPVPQRRSWSSRSAITGPSEPHRHCPGKPRATVDRAARRRASRSGAAGYARGPASRYAAPAARAGRAGSVVARREVLLLFNGAAHLAPIALGEC